MPGQGKRRATLWQGENAAVKSTKMSRLPPKSTPTVSLPQRGKVSPKVTDEVCCKAVEEVYTKEFARLSLVTSVVTSSCFSAGHLIHRKRSPSCPPHSHSQNARSARLASFFLAHRGIAAPKRHPVAFCLAHLAPSSASVSASRDPSYERRRASAQDDTVAEAYSRELCRYNSPLRRLRRHLPQRGRLTHPFALSEHLCKR